MLQDNRDVELLSNILLTDFTDCFQNCHSLKLAASNIKFNLYNLEKIEEFSVSVRSIDSLIIVPGQPLPSSLRKLGLNGLRNLTDLTPLQHLEELELNSIDTIVSVEPLGTIPVLKLSGLGELKSLNGLGRGNKDVYIRDCGEISSFLPLQSVEKVHLYNCPLKIGNDVKDVTHLILKQCPIEDVSSLSNIRTLEILDCGMVKNYQTLKNNKFIKIEFIEWSDDLLELMSQCPNHRVGEGTLCIRRS